MVKQELNGVLNGYHEFSILGREKAYWNYVILAIVGW